MTPQIASIDFAWDAGDDIFIVWLWFDWGDGVPDRCSYGVNAFDAAPICVELYRRVKAGEVPLVPMPAAPVPENTALDGGPTDA
jgi:hypothetical protein